MNSLLLAEIVLILLIAVGTGLVGSLLGIGGGVFLVPILTIMLNIDIRIAAATSLVAVIVTSSTSASSYLHEGFVNISLGMFMEVFTTAGAVFSAMLVVLISPSAIELIFGIVLVYAAVYMYFKRNEDRYEVEEEKQNAKFRGRFVSCYRDDATGEIIRYKVKKIKRGAAASFVAGNLSGLIGIGGGIVKVPVMNIWMKVPIKAASATSNFMIGVTAVASVLVYLSNGFIAPVLTAIVALGVFIGAFIGSRTMPRLKGKSIQLGLVAAFLVIAIIMIWKSSGWLL